MTQSGLAHKSLSDYLNPIPPGGGGGGGVPAPISTFENFLDTNLNVATFTKIYWRTRFLKKFASRVSHVAMATAFLTPCLLKF